jgi:hypothetical protein
VGRTASKGGQGRRRSADLHAIGPHHCAADDHLTGSAVKARNSHDCIEAGAPTPVEASDIIAAQAMIRRRSHGDLDPWLERAKPSLVASFANGVDKDKVGVSAATK